MNDLQLFKDSQFGEIRVIQINEKPYFVGIDIAKALGYKDPNSAITRHCKGSVKHPVPTNSGIQQMNVIPTGDIYRLAANSELPGAEKFESWIFDEVVPSVVKHGAYITPDTLDKMISSPEFGIKLLTALKEEQDKNKQLKAVNSALTVQNTIMAPKAEYFDELVDRNLLTNFRETAKQLGIKQNDFINFLIDKKYVYRDKKGKLMPYADKNNGLFELKECFNEKTDWKGTQTLITPKGRETFRLLYLKTA